MSAADRITARRLIMALCSGWIELQARLDWLAAHSPRHHLWDERSAMTAELIEELHDTETELLFWSDAPQAEVVDLLQRAEASAW